MRITVDLRETSLLQHINNLVTNIPIFKTSTVVSNVLPIGDIVISDGTEDKLIIERKSVSDLLASIKDGRYDEQSYRLNGLNHHNHNIIYLIEGDINRFNSFRSDNRSEKLTLYSSMFSLNYYKGFSVVRSMSIEESATMICNMAYKLEKESNAGKRAFYKLCETIKSDEKILETNQVVEENSVIADQNTKDQNTQDQNTKDQNTKDQNTKEEHTGESDKDYVSVVKKVKKENITCDNIGEIMLCQIPGISSVSALAIMDKYKSLPNLLNAIQQDNDCLKDISYTNSKGQTRKISKTCSVNIVKYLYKK